MRSRRQPNGCALCTSMCAGVCFIWHVCCRTTIKQSPVSSPANAVVMWDHKCWKLSCIPFNIMMHATPIYIYIICSGCMRFGAVIFGCYSSTHHHQRGPHCGAILFIFGSFGRANLQRRSARNTKNATLALQRSLSIPTNKERRGFMDLSDFAVLSYLIQ